MVPLLQYVKTFYDLLEKKNSTLLHFVTEPLLHFVTEPLLRAKSNKSKLFTRAKTNLVLRS